MGVRGTGSEGRTHAQVSLRLLLGSTRHLNGGVSRRRARRKERREEGRRKGGGRRRKEGERS